jgi:hypothetical protein
MREVDKNDNKRFSCGQVSHGVNHTSFNQLPKIKKGRDTARLDAKCSQDLEGGNGMQRQKRRPEN